MLHAGTLQNAAAGFHRGTGRKNVIHNTDRFKIARYVSGIKRIHKVLKALGSTELFKGLCVFTALQCTLKNRDAKRLAQPVRQHGGLVVASPPFPCRMNRNRYKSIYLHLLQMFPETQHGLLRIIIEIFAPALVFDCPQRTCCRIIVIHEGNAVVKAEAVLPAVMAELLVVRIQLTSADFTDRLRYKMEGISAGRTDFVAPRHDDLSADRTAARKDLLQRALRKPPPRSPVFARRLYSIFVLHQYSLIVRRQYPVSIRRLYSVFIIHQCQKECPHLYQRHLCQWHQNHCRPEHPPLFFRPQCPGVSLQGRNSAWPLFHF